jgi:hypothetical protein
VKVRIIGDAPVATVLTGLLAEEKHEVVWNPGLAGSRRLKLLKRRKEIRIVLPQGWIRTEAFGLSSSKQVRAEELGVIAIPEHSLGELKPVGAGDRIGSKGSTLLFLDCDPGVFAAQGSTALQGLSLLDTFELNPGNVEVTTLRPWLVIEKSPLLRELKLCLKGCGIGVLEVDEFLPYRNSLFLWKLLALPVAMCHTTLNNFLSYREGREIAIHLLVEGMGVFARQAVELKKLPIMDPHDLLQKLEKKPEDFDRFRDLPDRSFPSALQYVLLGEGRIARWFNDKLIRMSSQTGADPKWNWSLTRKMSRVLGVGFFRDPVDLYNAISQSSRLVAPVVTKRKIASFQPVRKSR